MFDPARPIYTLTVGEFRALLQEAQQPETKGNSETQQRDAAPRRLVYGINGLAELLGTSRPTAQRIKSSGKIDEAVSQEGRSIVIDADKVLELLKK